MEETEENKQPMIEDVVVVAENNTTPSIVDIHPEQVKVILDPNFLRDAKKLGRPKDETQGGYLCGWRIMQGRRKGQLCARTAKWDGSLLGDLYGQPIISWFCKRHFLMVMKEKNNTGGYMHVVKQDDMAKVLNEKLKEIRDKEQIGHFDNIKKEETQKFYADFNTSPKPADLPLPEEKKVRHNDIQQERDVLNMSQTTKPIIGLKINIDGETENPPSSGSEDDGVSSSDNDDMETSDSSSSEEMEDELPRKGVIATLLRQQRQQMNVG